MVLAIIFVKQLGDIIRGLRLDGERYISFKDGGE